jgi:membrane protease YdiL (CAAX protease family)
MTTVFGAVLTGIGVLLAGNLPWGALLAPLNLRVLTTVPWAVLPMAAYLWIYWRFISGAIGFPENAAWRREQLRAKPLSSDVWGLALLAGLAGFAVLLTFVSVWGRMVRLPDSAPLTVPTAMPSITVFLLLVTGSVVAGVTEEAGFRGYMQTPIERRFGLTTAILINGSVFGLLHFPNHPHHVLPMLPYYIAVSAVYGGITSAADSILPALVLHASGDVWSLTRLWMTGLPEWQIAAKPAPLIWQTGVDTGFVIEVVILFVFSAGMWWLCTQTARLRIAQAMSARSPVDRPS